MKKQLIILGVVVVIIGVLAVWLNHGGVPGSSSSTNTEEGEVTGDPIDTALEFYNDWLQLVSGTSTNPYQSELAQASYLSTEVQAYLASEPGQTDTGLDPVLCQPAIPERVGGKLSFQQDRKAQVLVLARGLETKTASQAVADLQFMDGEWHITKLSCSFGESAPEREFSFEREGYLLKSVPAPLNPDYWHLVFSENDTPGHTAPLFFSETSVCVAVDGTETSCDESMFQEASKAVVKGQMNEAGVDVQRLEMQASE